MKILNHFTALVTLCFLRSGCATIFTGTKQTIQINSKPTGAKVQVDGIDRGSTPVAIKLKRGNEGQTITLNAEGYEPRIFQPETGFNTIAILNLLNILFWGIDAAIGALWKYDPKFYEIELVPKSSISK